VLGAGFQVQFLSTVCLGMILRLGRGISGVLLSDRQDVCI
jgi:hypothetical protein